MRPARLAALSIAALAALLLCGLALNGQASPARERQGLPAAVESPAPNGELPYPIETYQRGNAYPAAVTVDLGDTTIAPGAREAFVTVSLSGETANTVIAFVRCVNGVGAGPVRDRTQAVIFRPGDPLRATASCPIREARAGSTVRFAQAQVPDGAKRGVQEAFARIASGAASQEIGRQGFRAPYRFTPLGPLVYSAGGAQMRFGDEGGPDTWTTALFHGRVQPSNGETGFYGEAALGGFQRRGGDLAMVTRKLDQPVARGFDAKPYPFLAAALSAHNMPETKFRYGSVEWEVMMPDRRGSWPGLWLLTNAGWPPEIDVYEGFGYNRDWNLATDLSTNLHGGQDNRRRFTRSAYRMQMGDFGLPGTLTSEFHKFQVTVDPAWITLFVDGIETMRYANPFGGRTWYPLMTVAVKEPPSSAYDAGSGAMVIRSVKVWRAE